MTYCGQCGQDVAGLRFCTRCGAPVDDAPRAQRPDTAGTSAAATEPREPDDTPPIWVPLDPEPTQPRAEPPPEPLGPAPSPAAVPPSAPLGPPPPDRPRRAGWVPWAVAIWAVLAVAAAVVAWRVGSGDAEEARTVDRGSTVAPETPDATPTSAEIEPTEPTEPTESTSDPASAAPADLASTATATAPETATPNQDVDGDLVRYEARNMLDGVPATCWRMPGDGAGTELTFTFPQPVTLTQVGLVNGYAKIDGDVDWYMRNRRLVSAEWVFDDGTVVPESFADSLDPQVLDVEPVTTSTVTLRIVETTDPAPGPDGRDYTPVSDVVLVGTPAG